MPERMITYLTPTTVDKVDQLLNRPGVKTVVRAGGTALTEADLAGVDTVVDLAQLNLDFIEYRRGLVHIGAMTPLRRLQTDLTDIAGGMLAYAAGTSVVPEELLDLATLGGMLASGDIHTSLSVLLGALKARIKIYKMAGESPFWVEMTKKVRINNGLGKQVLTTVSVNLPVDTSEFSVAYAQVDEPDSQRAVVSAATALRRQGGNIQVHVVVGGLRVDLIAQQAMFKPTHTASAIDKMVGRFDALRGPIALYLNDHIADADYRKRIALDLVAESFEHALEQFQLS